MVMWSSCAPLLQGVGVAGGGGEEGVGEGGTLEGTLDRQTPWHRDKTLQGRCSVLFQSYLSRNNDIHV